MFHVNPDKDIIFESKNCLNLILYKVVLVGLPYTGLALNWILVSPDNIAGVLWNRYSIRVLYLYCMRAGIYKGMNPT